MATAKVAETSANINTNSPSQNSTNMDDLKLQTSNAFYLDYTEYKKSKLVLRNLTQVYTYARRTYALH